MTVTGGQSTGHAHGPHRYPALDMLRGTGALIVLMGHMVPRVLPGRAAFYHFTLAVDLFFMLSGFVLAHAYQAKLEAGGRPLYLRERVIRLQPMIVITTLPGAVWFLARNLVRGQLPPGQDWISALAAFVPFPALWRGSDLGGRAQKLWFEFNPPVWSLFWELVVSFVYGLVAPLLSNRVLGGVVFACAIALVGCAVLLPQDASYGGLRAFAGFSIGLMLYRLHRTGGYRFEALQRWSIPLLLAGTIMPSLGGWLDRLYPLAMILVLFPILLLSAAAWRYPHPRLAAIFGDLSYPLYLVHFPIIIALNALAASGVLPLTPLELVPLKIVLALPAAWIAWRYYDVPVRAALRRRFVKRPDAARSAPAR